jgi:hypothetical protein
VVKDPLYSHFFWREGGYYIAIFPGAKIAREKGYYTTPIMLKKNSPLILRKH